MSMPKDSILQYSQCEDATTSPHTRISSTFERQTTFIKTYLRGDKSQGKSTREYNNGGKAIFFVLRNASYITSWNKELHHGTLRVTTI
jgi:hypothetical protein